MINLQQYQNLESQTDQNEILSPDNESEMSRQLEESEPDEESEDKLYRQSSPKVDVEEDY